MLASLVTKYEVLRALQYFINIQFGFNVKNGKNGKCGVSLLDPRGSDNP